jgi:hypothetical protein
MLKCFRFCFNFAFNFNLRRYTEDFAADVTRHLEFRGGLADARDARDAALAAAAGGAAPLIYVADRNGEAARAVELGRGLHSSTIQLNLSRF